MWTVSGSLMKVIDGKADLKSFQLLNQIFNQVAKNVFAACLLFKFLAIVIVKLSCLGRRKLNMESKVVALDLYY